MKQEPSAILRNFRLRNTDGRKAIIDLFLEAPIALSHRDIEEKVKGPFDRVTLYRTLKTFFDKGLIHRVLDDTGGAKYALCAAACSYQKHHHDHVHFKCIKCGQTSCLEVEIPEMKLPRGYEAREVNFLIQGICKACQIF